MKISELAKYVDTNIARVIQDCEVDVAELCAAVKGPNAITYLEKEQFLPYLSQSGIAAVICTEDLADKIPSHIRGVLISDAPKFAFYQVHNHLAEQIHTRQIPTIISKTAVISPRAVIAPYNVEIDDGVIVEAGAIIGEYVSIGSGSHICAGTIIGTDSFNPSRYLDRAVTLTDCGTVKIGRNVKICSHSVVIRGVLLGEITEIGDNTKIDTFVHVAHGVHIGRRTFIASGAILGGNCHIGQDVWIGINATLRNRICIGDKARVSMGAAVTKNVPAGATVSGNFAIDHQQFMQNLKSSLSSGQNVGNCPPPVDIQAANHSHISSSSGCTEAA